MKFDKNSKQNSKKKSVKSAPKTKKTSKKAKALLDDGDEIVDVSGIEEKKEAEKVVITPVKSFEGGIVHEALKTAVNAHWRRSAESDIFMSLLKDELSVSGTYVGSIYIKSSFTKKQGGQFFL